MERCVLPQHPMEPSCILQDVKIRGVSGRHFEYQDRPVPFQRLHPHAALLADQAEELVERVMSSSEFRRSLSPSSPPLIVETEFNG